ncbi:glycyl-radical enzyme activating protein [Leptotrichia sp. OH3620_COT-345]|uniref:glycyl-radical enzyme activating protein n=1 Tax=Leptotrichia sp. OH3620_COT-345 TaxID=2491048 RepID=UPI000F64A7F8|nr:glycyl-radical enzyme activating protein [Leptotrichia sp. OH3620_COT-345]RRD40697.1 glycyl-radical enzyme activating protein [Leptotrichia sp. OH3620_COT-345]
MEEALVTGIERGATFDGPGIRTVVYLKGCPLRCLWCSNPETQKTENEVYWDYGAICPITGELPKVAKKMTLNEVFKEVMKDEKFYRKSGGGVTLSGGEILVNAKFAIKLFEKLKEEYIGTAIETTGFGNYEELESLAKLTDTVLFDIKHMNSEKHKQYTAVSNKVILENLERLSKWHKNIIMRFPFIKGVNDDKENIAETAKFLKKVNLLDVDILPYHTMGLEKYRKLRRPYPMPTLVKHTKEELEEAVEIMKEIGVRAKINQ